MRFQAFRDFGRISHTLGGENHEQAIAVRIARGDFEGATVALRIGVSEDVDGVVVAPVSGQKFVEVVQAIRGKIRQFSASRYQRISGQNSRSAGVSDDRETRTFGARLPAEHFRI